jgi:type I restriction enzyme, S subunit
MINANDNWKKFRLKNLFEKRIGGAWGDEPNLFNSIVCIRAADFETDKIAHVNTELTRRSFDETEILNKSLKKGDLIIEKSGGGENQPVGRIALFELDEPALCSNFLEILRPKQKIVLPKFSAYLLYSLWTTRLVTLAIKQTTGIQNLDISDYLDNKVQIPDVKKQELIIQFLTKEISHIDSLLKAKEKFIDLLIEKRQSLITQAVTKGLNNKVKLKDSGIDWLGKVPEHWKILQLKQLCNGIKTGGTPSPNWINHQSNNLINWYTPGDISESIFLSKSSRQISKEAVLFEKFNIFPAGTILVVGIGATLGKVGITKTSAYCNQQINALKTKQNVSEYFLGYLLFIMIDVMKVYSNTSTLPILNQYKMGALHVLYPPYEEQKEIVTYIETEVLIIDKIKSKTEISIQLLKERRKALISAAVTGQLKI